MNHRVFYFFPTATDSRFGVEKMNYEVISHRIVGGKTQGETLTEKELLALGANIEALINGDHIKKISQSSKIENEGAK